MRTLEQIAALHWTDTQGQEDLLVLVEDALTGIEAPGISTTDLMQRMGAKSVMYKSLANQLGVLRRDYPLMVTKGDKPGMYGKPSYKWHASALKPAMTNVERLAQIRADLGDEEFFALYHQKPATS